MPMYIQYLWMGLGLFKLFLLARPFVVWEWSFPGSLVFEAGGPTDPKHLLLLHLLVQPLVILVITGASGRNQLQFNNLISDLILIFLLHCQLSSLLSSLLINNWLICLAKLWKIMFSTTVTILNMPCSHVVLEHVECTVKNSRLSHSSSS